MDIGEKKNPLAKIVTVLLLLFGLACLGGIGLLFVAPDVLPSQAVELLPGLPEGLDVTEFVPEEFQKFLPFLEGTGEDTEPDGSFRDDFGDPSSGWETGEYQDGSVGYGEGVYVVTSLGDGSKMWGVANRSFGDVSISVEATQLSAGPENDNSYGVGCRIQPDGSGYYLSISGDGYYAIGMAVVADGEEMPRLKPLVDWTESNAIRQGNAVNHLRVVCAGSQLALYVNDQLLAEIQGGGAFPEGDVALVATSYENAPTEVHFDDIVIEQGWSGMPVAPVVSGEGKVSEGAEEAPSERGEPDPPVSGQDDTVSPPADGDGSDSAECPVVVEQVIVQGKAVRKVEIELTLSTQQQILFDVPKLAGQPPTRASLGTAMDALGSRSSDPVTFRLTFPYPSEEPPWTLVLNPKRPPESYVAPRIELEVSP
jgi:hypothetical protein